MSHVYCPECGYQNPEAANYCARCGAHLVKEEGSPDATLTLPPLEDEEGSVTTDELGAVKGPALIVRSGGGRAGETFPLGSERTTVGRSPDCGIFLDDVTVSRKHAVLTQRNQSFVIEDQGSLNGTYVNRRRIDEPTPLDDGDELQVGKYRLTFLSR